ncbi:MAG: PA14 domain-containing protein [Fimbriimonadales bacterium]
MGAHAFYRPRQRPRGENYALHFTGWFQASEDGVHEFHLGSDDGSRLRIGGATIVEQDGPQAYAEKSGKVRLKRGLHAIDIQYFQIGGAQRLTLDVTPPGGSRRPATNLFCDVPERRAP